MQLKETSQNVILARYFSLKTGTKRQNCSIKTINKKMNYILINIFIKILSLSYFDLIRRIKLKSVYWEKRKSRKDNIFISKIMLKSYTIISVSYLWWYSYLQCRNERMNNNNLNNNMNSSQTGQKSFFFIIILYELENNTILSEELSVRPFFFSFFFLILLSDQERKVKSRSKERKCKKRKDSIIRIKGCTCVPLVID